MGLFGNTINEGYKEYQNTPDALLIDVREEDEYRSGHIPGAVNIPLSKIQQADLPADKEQRLFVYCLSGARSGRAVSFLNKSGYVNVKNIGGIKSYKGPVER